MGEGWRISQRGDRAPINADIPTVKELIDRIMGEAEQIIRGRLTGLLDGTLDTKPTRAVA
jgi:hypothetical protein